MEAGQTPGFGAEPVESITRNAVVVLALQLFSAAATAVLTVYLARALGPKDFGVFSLALGIGAVILLPSDFGISNSAARYIAERRGDPVEVAAVLRTAVRLKVALAGAFSLALFVAAGPLADAYDEEGLAWAMRGMALAVFGQNVRMLYGATFAALARISLARAAVVSGSVVELGASIALVAAGAGATGAAFGRGAGYLFGAVMAATVAYRQVFRRAAPGRKAVKGVRPRDLAMYGGALLVVEGAYSLFDQIDVLLIGAFLSASSVALFQAPLRLISLVVYPGAAVAMGVAPRLASHEREPPNVHAFMRGLRYLLIFQMAVTVPLVVWAQPIVDLVLGEGYEKSAEVLRALGPYILLGGVGPLVALSVNYLGAARRRVPIAISALLINLVIDLTLIPEIGIVAGAIGTDVAYAVYVPAHLWICKRMLDLDLRPLVATLIRTFLAGGAMAGAMAAFGVSSLGPVDWVAGAFAGLSAYGAVLLVTREVTVRELRELVLSARLDRLRGRRGKS